MAWQTDMEVPCRSLLLLLLTGNRQLLQRSQRRSQQLMPSPLSSL